MARIRTAKKYATAEFEQASTGPGGAEGSGPGPGLR